MCCWSCRSVITHLGSPVGVCQPRVLPPGPKLQPEVKPFPELVSPSAGADCWGLLGKELVLASEHAVLMALLTDALQELYGDMHWL